MRESTQSSVPPAIRTGRVVSAAWDFEGEGTFSVPSKIDKSNSAVSGSQVTLKMTHLFAKLGTYFQALLGTSQRDGDPSAPFTRIPNLGKVRVIVK
jgi:hypothetical protein